MMDQAVTEPVTLMQLRNHCCKFPVAGPNARLVGLYLFCAAPTQPGESYCDKHHALTLQKGERK